LYFVQLGMDLIPWQKVVGVFCAFFRAPASAADHGIANPELVPIRKM
jgi:hypothetical protein